jgi:hypothetical protein
VVMRLCRFCALFLASAMASLQETPLYAETCDRDFDAPSGKRAPPICCSQLNLQTQVGGEASTLCTFNASAMTFANSNRTIREPLTLVYSDESQSIVLDQLCSRSPHWGLRCIIFARFREVRWTNFHESVSAPIHHSVLMVRQRGMHQWEAGPELGRFPDAGVMMMADELGDFDRSFNTLCAFSLHMYWLDDPDTDVYVPAVSRFIPTTAPGFWGFPGIAFCQAKPRHYGACSGVKNITKASRRRHFFSFIGSVRANRDHMIQAVRSLYTPGETSDSRYLMIVRSGFGGPVGDYDIAMEHSAFVLCPCGET